MARLTQDHRKIILERMLKHGFGERLAAIKAEEHKIATEVYDFAYSDKVQKQMEVLPKGFLHEEGTITIYVSGASFKLNLGKMRRISRAMCGYYSTEQRIAVLDSDPIGVRVKEFFQKKSQLEDAYNAAESQAKTVLDSVKTLSKLLDVWPEVEAFTTDIAAEEKKVTSLAIPIASLNRILELPPDDQK